MELAGEEQKLQALFSELKAEDQQTAPAFATVWNRARVAPRRIRPLNPAFVATTALLACALISLAVWSRHFQRVPQQPVVKIEAPSRPADAVGPEVKSTVAFTSTAPEPGRRPRSSSPLARWRAQVAAADRKLTLNAKKISNWQSPTSTLLSSSSDQLFSSLPQLNQSVTELKSFLPN